MLVVEGVCDTFGRFTGLEGAWTGEFAPLGAADTAVEFVVLRWAFIAS